MTFDYEDRGFTKTEVMGWDCTLSDTATGLRVEAHGDTPNGAEMRALGVLTGCWWQYAARQ